MDKNYIVCTYEHRSVFGKLLCDMDFDFCKCSNKFTVHFTGYDMKAYKAAFKVTRMELVEKFIQDNQLGILYIYV